jgi:hypothetical protein
VSKQNGLGDQFFFGGYVIGGDVQELSLHGGNSPIDVTDITQYAHSRLGGVRDGEIAWTSFFDNAAGAAHQALSPLTRADVICGYLRGQAVGAPALCQQSLQLNYDPARGTSGELTEKVTAQADRYGQEWGIQLTAGTRTDTVAASGASWNRGAGSAFGAQAYLNASALTGTDVTVTVQHSPDNATWSTLLAFAQVISSASNLPPSAQRVATPSYQFSATDASPAVFTVAGSGAAPANGTPLALAAAQGQLATTLPGGFTAGTTYYVVSSSGSTFELSATSGGSAVNSTTTGSGTAYPVVQQYVRAVTTTVSGFTSFSFIAALMANQVAVSF